MQILTLVSKGAMSKIFKSIVKTHLQETFICLLVRIHLKTYLFFQLYHGHFKLLIT